MSQDLRSLSKGILGAFAVLADVRRGAVRVGPRSRQRVAGRRFADRLVSAEAGINRAAKADRAAGVSASAAPTQTISLRLEGLSDTSVLVRIPRRPGGPRHFVRANRRSEAWPASLSVSVLTEVAKRLQPGRCVT